FRRVLFRSFRGSLCLSRLPSADALGYFLSSYGLGPRQNRRGLRRIGNGVIQSAPHDESSLLDGHQQRSEFRRGAVVENNPHLRYAGGRLDGLGDGEAFFHQGLVVWLIETEADRFHGGAKVAAGDAALRENEIERARPLAVFLVEANVFGRPRNGELERAGFGLIHLD